MESKSNFEDLGNYIDRKSLVGLNLTNNSPLEGLIFERGGGRLVQSEKGDPQLLISFEFSSNVKVHHFSLKGGSDKATWPKTIKVFANTGPMDFSTAENDTPTQVIELKEKEFNKDIELKFVKFQSVKSISVFVEDNHGGDSTILSELVFYGISGNQTDMKQFRPIDEHDH